MQIKTLDFKSNYFVFLTRGKQKINLASVTLQEKCLNHWYYAKYEPFGLIF